MAEITPHRNGELLRTVFEVLMTEPEGLQAKEVLARLEAKVEFSDFERGSYPSSPGTPRWHKILRFATIPLVKAGWLLKERGVWSVTDDGRAAFQKHKDPEAFYRTADRVYQDWRSSRPEPVEGPDELEGRVERVRITYEQASEDSWLEISDYLQNMDPYDFQELVAELLKAMDYHVYWVAPRGKDYGVDIIAHTDPLGATKPRIKVQVKRRADPTAVEGLRAFMSVLGDDDVGIFVCSGGFTRDAEDEARTQERRKITLIDQGKLFDLWVEHYDRLTQEARQRMPLRPIYFLAPGE
jgi:restriction system protein